MDKIGLDIYNHYAGKEAVESFLSGFAPTNPYLAEMTVLFAYRFLLADPILNYTQKAFLIYVILYTNGNSPMGLNFHREAFFRHGGYEAQLNFAKDLVLELKNRLPQNTISLAQLVDRGAIILNHDLVFLGLIAAIVACGDQLPSNLLEWVFSLCQDLKVSHDKILYTINLIAPYAGLPLAIAGSMTWQNYISKNT